MKMTNNAYNGWTNRSTWLINVWYSPTTTDLDWIKEELEGRVADLANSDNMSDHVLADMLNLQEVNWDELTDSLEDPEEE